MNIKKQKNFANGTVYCLQLEDGKLIETTDTFLPYYTKDAIGRKQNMLDNDRRVCYEWLSGWLQVLCNRPNERLPQPDRR